MMCSTPQPIIAPLADLLTQISMLPSAFQDYFLASVIKVQDEVIVRNHPANSKLLSGTLPANNKLLSGPFPPITSYFLEPLPANNKLW